MAVVTYYTDDTVQISNEWVVLGENGYLVSDIKFVAVRLSWPEHFSRLSILCGLSWALALAAFFFLTADASLGAFGNGSPSGIPDLVDLALLLVFVLPVSVGIADTSPQWSGCLNSLLLGLVLVVITKIVVLNFVNPHFDYEVAEWRFEVFLLGAILLVIALALTSWLGFAGPTWTFVIHLQTTFGHVDVFASSDEAYVQKIRETIDMAIRNHAKRPVA
jgi:hypothetical protein